MENKKIAQRITEQYSTLRKTLVGDKSMPKTSEKKKTYASWNYSPLKTRQLPKLVGPERLSSIGSESAVSHSRNGSKVL